MWWGMWACVECRVYITATRTSVNEQTLDPGALRCSQCSAESVLKLILFSGLVLWEVNSGNLLRAPQVQSPPSTMRKQVPSCTLGIRGARGRTSVSRRHLLHNTPSPFWTIVIVWPSGGQGKASVCSILRFLVLSRHYKSIVASH